MTKFTITYLEHPLEEEMTEIDIEGDYMLSSDDSSAVSIMVKAPGEDEEFDIEVATFARVSSCFITPEPVGTMEPVTGEQLKTDFDEKAPYNCGCSFCLAAADAYNERKRDAEETAIRGRIQEQLLQLSKLAPAGSPATTLSYYFGNFGRNG